MALPAEKWWHVADQDVAELVADLGGSNPFGHLHADTTQDPSRRATVATAIARPPRPRVPGSPQPPVATDVPLTTYRPPSSGPHVKPGTPLMTHRSPRRALTPRRPLSARRSYLPQKSDCNITVYVYNMHSADRLVLRVSPDLQIGPSAPATAQEGCEDATFYDKGERANNELSLKGEISKALGIDLLQIRLMCRGSPLGCDEKTLRGYSINDEDTVHMRLRRSSSSSGRSEVVLAGAAKKAMQEAEWLKDEMLGLRPYAMQPQSCQSRLSQRCSDNGVALMPRWVSQEHPKLFAPVGIGLDGHGGANPYEDFNLQGIWTAPVDHPNQRGQNQYGLQRVRESLAAKGGSHGGA